MKKRILIGILVIAVAVGLFFGIKYQIRVYRAIVITQRGLADMVNFVKNEFPEEVADYTAKMNKSALPATTPAPAPTK